MSQYTEEHFDEDHRDAFYESICRFQLPALSALETATLTEQASGSFTSMSSCGYLMTTVFVSYERPYRVPVADYPHRPSSRLAFWGGEL
jgi:hypothetical protein